MDGVLAAFFVVVGRGIDLMLLEIMKSAKNEIKSAIGGDLNEFKQLTDDSLLSILLAAKIDQGRALLDGINHRKLYKMVYEKVFKWNETNSINEQVKCD